MKLRLAKKVFKAGPRYTGPQRNAAAVRIYRWARVLDKPLAMRALQFQPVSFVVVDNPLDLKREELEGKAMRAAAGVPEPVVIPSDTPRPVYRRDGQAHNFEALPWPGADKRWHLTRKRYDARYAGDKPVPKRYHDGES